MIEDKNIQGTINRQYGIDLLRIIAMFFVIIGHIIGQGGILEFSETNNVNYNLVLFFKVFSLCSINIFGVISGYVGYGTLLKWKKLVLLWFQIIFWTVMILCIFSIVNDINWNSKTLTRTFFPILSGTYWYMTGYFLVMLLSPIMNLFVDKFPIWFVVTSIIIAVSFLSIVITTSGNNGVWLCLEYMIGAIIRKSKIYEVIKPGIALSGYVMCILFTWLAVFLQKIGLVNWNRILWSIVGGGQTRWSLAVFGFNEFSRYISIIVGSSFTITRKIMLYNKVSYTINPFCLSYTCKSISI